MAISPVGAGAAIPAAAAAPAGGAGGATGVTPLSDAGSILAESVEIGDDDDGGAFADGYELELSDDAMGE